MKRAILCCLQLFMIIKFMVLNALTIRPKNTTTSAVQATSLRGSKQLDNIGTADADTYTSKYGYFLQMQHETTECPPYGRMDVTWANGIRIGQLSPYILNSDGESLNLMLLECDVSRTRLRLNIETTGSQIEPRCDAKNFAFANCFQCVDNPYAYSDFAGVQQLAYSSESQCKMNAAPVGFITWVNGACYDSKRITCDPTTKIVTTVSYADPTCSTETDTLTQTFSEKGMGTCDSTGIKYICRKRGTNKYPK